ncbi:MAG: hypothetical protein LBC56_04825 [Oscillospiraceae bacterium]|jgi:hypothetical protein|nr:hypothetical protein [Oscillospiraceae bacterium]
MGALLSEKFAAKAFALARDYCYLDEEEVQTYVLSSFIQGTAEQLWGAGVPVQEENIEYLEAIYRISAYKYMNRTSLNAAIGAMRENMGYNQMIWDYVHRLRYPDRE